MFDDNFYVRFNDNNHSYTLYVDNSPVYGKELAERIDEHYSYLEEPLLRVFEFEKDINDAFKEYCRVCHIPVVYDNFSESMKEFLDSQEIFDRKFLCEYQRMTRKELFRCFDGADIDLLYEVSCVLFAERTTINDVHEEMF